jgi:GTPase SAR1 family protein
VCSNPFGIVDNQLLFQCSEAKCGEQYCNSCVQAIRGSPPKHSFVCITCKKEVTPERNMLIETHIIWKSMCKLYGIQSLLDLKDSKSILCNPILKNIQIRRDHLKSRLDTIKSRLDSENNQGREQDSRSSFDKQLIDDVNNLYIVLENLTERLKEIDHEMRCRGIIVKSCLEKYKKAMKHFDRLCYTSTKSMVRPRSNDTTITTDVFDAEKEEIKQVYRMNGLDTLSSEQNIQAIDDILKDIDFREHWLLVLKNTMSSSDINKVEKALKKISAVKEELNCLHGSLEAIKSYTDAYDKLLRDDQYPEIPCSKFILLLEKMRVRTEELEILNSFPQIGELMRIWQNDYGKDEEFKPKVIDLFKAIELDVQHLFTDYYWIYSLSYKVGVIGHGSVGKTAITMNLAEIKEYSSMIAVERSTFGYLQFDTLVYKDPDNNKIIPFSFIDIEGATDTDESESIGNYIELIKKADCDIYIIVFDNFFGDHNRICQEYIENDLKRKCVLVRSKADLLFNQYFRERTGENYEKTLSEKFDVDTVLGEIRNHASKTFDDKRLDSMIYLTAAVCGDNLKAADFAEFDMNKLKKKLVEFAMTDFREQRLCNLAIRAAITVVNTCFRRGYTVSQTKYKWLAAGASLIPFLDELPKSFGRKKIRQTFGIHDISAVTNTKHEAKDSFEEYLREKKLTVPNEYLRSGEFKYLRPRNTNEATTNTNVQLNKGRTSRNTPIVLGHQALSIAGNSFVVLGTVGKVAGDAARIVAPTATATLRIVSIAGIVVGVVLTPIFAAWSFYSTGQRMNEELHSMCDDLVNILHCFIVDRCNNCFQSIKLPVYPPSDEDSSSSDED